MCAHPRSGRPSGARGPASPARRWRGCTLEVVDGGYRLSGRWSFGSGCTHAEVICGGALVTEGGAPVPGPAGQPRWRVALLPAAEVEVHDTWHTTGLCGSGSHDYSIAEAMDTLAGKVRMPEMIPARDQPGVRAGVARAQSMVGSARSYVHDTLGSFWTKLESGDEPGFADRAALAGCFVHTVTTCRDAVAVLAETVGTAAIRRGTRLERHHRDLITIGTHLMGQPKMREWAGGLWFGQPAPSPIL